MNKIQRPCYFYNTGGCYHKDGSPKNDTECKYLHVKIDKPLEKPQHLKPPCKYYHLRGQCTNTQCIFGHSELSPSRWQTYFPAHPYPGQYYTKASRYNWKGIQNPDPCSKIKEKALALLLELLVGGDHTKEKSTDVWQNKMTKVAWREKSN